MSLSGGDLLPMRFRLPWDAECAGNECPPYENRKLRLIFYSRLKLQ